MQKANGQMLDDVLEEIGEIDKLLTKFSPKSDNLMYRQYQHLRGKYVQQLNELVAKYSKHLRVVEV